MTLDLAAHIEVFARRVMQDAPPLGDDELVTAALSEVA